ncbi:hypothetical protein SAMN05428949_4909 [Chitinophaga sp. YR627]|nr:hypothetical protein SAMN05428949_4909 [Chitinophaga sp. YR627]
MIFLNKNMLHKKLQEIFLRLHETDRVYALIAFPFNTSTTVSPGSIL